MKMLVTLPNYDKGTSYLVAWSKKVISLAKQKGIKVQEAEGEKANKKEIQSRLIKTKPDLVFFNGHGNKNNVCGHQLEIIVNKESANLLKNTITFCRACSCLQGLGKEAIKKGCKAFVGYNQKFIMPRFHKFEATPLKDPLAKPVLESSNQVPISLIKGSTVEEAVNASKEMTVKNISKILTLEDETLKASLRALIYNSNALSFEGNKNTKL